jgi:Fur family ferric uptake transcriptional regulator
MTNQPAIVEALREEGYRLTPQRMMILSAILDNKGHISAEEIHRRVCQQYPFVDISTVYRTLNLLKKLRLITETDLGGGCVHYELVDEGRHHHMICRVCGSTLALQHRFLQPLQRRLLKEYGFAADIDHFAIFGLCQECHEHEAGDAGRRGQHGNG